MVFSQWRADRLLLLVPGLDCFATSKNRAASAASLQQGKVSIHVTTLLLCDCGEKLMLLLRIFPCIARTVFTGTDCSFRCSDGGCTTDLPAVSLSVMSEDVINVIAVALS
jgi:hypothetical protein